MACNDGGDSDLSCEKVEEWAVVVVETLSCREFSEFIDDNKNNGCYGCGKKFTAAGLPYSVVKHCRHFGWQESKKGNWETMAVHRGCFYFLDSKLASLYSNMDNVDRDKGLDYFVRMLVVWNVESSVNVHEFEESEKFVFPITGDLVNLPFKWHHGEIVPRFKEAEIRQFLLDKGIEVVSIKALWDADGFCRCALLEFGSNLGGLVNARYFEQAFCRTGYGKHNWEAYFKNPGNSIMVFGWVIMEEDLYEMSDFCRTAVRERLSKMLGKQKVRVLSVGHIMKLLNSDAHKSSGSDERKV